jgi:hypothetical protein
MTKLESQTRRGRRKNPVVRKRFGVMLAIGSTYD